MGRSEVHFKVKGCTVDVAVAAVGDDDDAIASVIE